MKFTYTKIHSPTPKNKQAETYSISASPSARYYNSDLSIWISVDPLADKYPNLSPYTYCAGNPVVLKDHEGKDIWTIDNDGTIKRQKNTAFDRIDVIDVEGNTIKGTEVKYGTIKQRSPYINGKKADLFEINNDLLATETFENIANNTTIEWAHVQIGQEGSNRNIVGTSHDSRNIAVGNYLFEKHYTLRSIVHNHPSGNGWPSNIMLSDGTYIGDIPLAKKYEKGFPNIKLSIYVNGSSPLSNVNEWCKKGYHPYNSYGPILQNVHTVK